MLKILSFFEADQKCDLPMLPPDKQKPSVNFDPKKFLTHLLFFFFEFKK